MIKEAYLDKTRYLLSSLIVIGKGGEADVYRLPSGNVLKIYKTPDHLDFEGNKKEQEGAVHRIAEHQLKLKKFPKGLPKNVISPIQLATNRNGDAIVGYEMPFVDHAEWIRSLSDPSQHHTGLSNVTVTEVFTRLHEIVDILHQKGVVIADFNDLNILLNGNEPIIIDADSFQFAGFLTRTFTPAFVDPLLCNTFSGKLNLAKPHNEKSDWYAFAAVMLNSFLCCGGPYGGVYAPKDPTHRLAHDLRPLKRISVFNTEVRYPRPALTYMSLSDDLLHLFHQIFEKDERGIFPIDKLKRLNWQKCAHCGLEHARHACPTCTPQTIGQVIQTVIVTGKVTAYELFMQRGAVIVTSIYQGDAIKYVYHKNGAYYREDGSVILENKLDSSLKFRISGKTTLVARGNEFIAFENGREKFRSGVDSKGKTPICSANSSGYFWALNGELLRSESLGQEHVGNVLAGQTRFWVGEHFGFGFYQAGAGVVGFIFDTKKRGVNDSVKLPRIRGDVIDAACYFSSNLCWFFWSTQESGKTYNHCAVIGQNGLVIATDSAEQNDQDKPWLHSIKGKCAVSDKLLVATDDGIIRLSVNSSLVQLNAKYPDTDQFVDLESKIFPGKDGLYVIGPKSVKRLKIN